MLTLKDRNALVKKWLWRYRIYKLDLERLEGEYLEMISVQESVKAVSYDGMPVAGRITDLSDLIISRSNLSGRLKVKCEQLSKVRDEISLAVSRLEDPVQRSILSMRYLQFKQDRNIYSISEIADKLGYSASQVKTEHGAALSLLVPIINALSPDSQIPAEIRKHKS